VEFLKSNDGLRPCLDDASIKKHLPLRREIHHLYCGVETIKASGKGGVPLSWCHFIAEATSPVRSEKKEQEQKPTTPAHSEQ
jgi:hypothetical protein